jgi:hypothetical protein
MKPSSSITMATSDERCTSERNRSSDWASASRVSMSSVTSAAIFATPTTSPVASYNGEAVTTTSTRVPSLRRRLVRGWLMEVPRTAAIMTCSDSVRRSSGTSIR